MKGLFLNPRLSWAVARLSFRAVQGRDLADRSRPHDPFSLESVHFQPVPALRPTPCPAASARVAAMGSNGLAQGQSSQPVPGGARLRGNWVVSAEGAYWSRCVRIFLMIAGSSRQLLPALLSSSVPDSLLPPPSMGSYLLHSCSRMQAMTRKDALMPRAHGCAGAATLTAPHIHCRFQCRQGELMRSIKRGCPGVC